MSSVSGYGSDGARGGGRAVLELPVTLSAQKTGKQRSPQENIDEFWSKFTTKAPGRGEQAGHSCLYFFNLPMHTP